MKNATMVNLVGVKSPLNQAVMKAIIAKAKPIYHFSAGLHSAETGPPEMVIELAYRLAEAWRHRVPKRLAAAYDASRQTGA